MWRAIRDVNTRILLVQNTHTNAVAKLRTIRETVEKNPLFRSLYPEVLPDSTCVWKSDSLCLLRKKALQESTFEAAGSRTQVTSRHYDLIIEDDTVAPELDDLGEQNLCPTKDDVEHAIGWHRLVSPLFVNFKTCQNLVVGTRWFEKDLLSWIKDNEPSFKFYERACREDNEGLPDERGHITYPERFDKDVLSDLYHSLGPYMFSCLYLNKPLRSSEMIFDPSWFVYYETEDRDLITYTTVDLGGTPEDTKGEPDWNVVLTCGKSLDTGNIFVLDYTRKKCNPSELISMIFEHVRKWKPVKVGIETTQYQNSIQYWVRERMRAENLYFMIEGMRHSKKSKEQRVIGLQPVVSNGFLRFRRSMTSLVNELLTFPLGVHDDLADALATQLPLWAETRSKQALKRDDFDCDPLNVRLAIKHIREKKELKSKKSLVFDIYSRNEHEVDPLSVAGVIGKSWNKGRVR